MNARQEGLSDKPVVLVVDDCCDYLDIVGEMLEPAYHVRVASTAGRALQLAAQEPRPDAIILDVVMPDMDGYQLLEALRRNAATCDIPAIFMTSLDGALDETAGLTHGAADYIVKPPLPEVLRARVRTQIELKRMRDSLRQRNEALQAEIERREGVEQALQRTVRDLESFAYSVSHDLRSPLTTIGGFAVALQQSEAPSLSAKGQNWLERIIAGTRKLDAMIDDILTYSRAERAEFRRRPVDLRTLAAEVVDGAATAYPGARVTLGPLGTVSGDPAMLRRMLGNLVDNALKFSAKRPDARVEIGSRPVPDGTELFVRDNGAGFDMAYAHKLFGLFQRLHSDREFPGTGLGLAVVKRLAARHGGEVRAESVPGAWTVFTLALPSAGYDPLTPREAGGAAPKDRDTSVVFHSVWNLIGDWRG